MPSGNFADHVLVTMNHIHFSKDILANYLLNHGASAVIISREYHGGTEKNMQQRIIDPEDSLNS